MLGLPTHNKRAEIKLAVRIYIPSIVLVLVSFIMPIVSRKWSDSMAPVPLDEPACTASQWGIMGTRAHRTMVQARRCPPAPPVDPLAAGAAPTPAQHLQTTTAGNSPTQQLLEYKTL